MKARNILDGLEKLGWFDDYIDITCWRDGAQVVSSQYGEPYAEDGFLLQEVDEAIDFGGDQRTV